jgi:hypothetical protein
MGIPQIALIIMYAFALGNQITLHGKPKEGTNSIFPILVGVAIELSLLIWGGFFTGK